MKRRLSPHWLSAIAPLAFVLLYFFAPNKVDAQSQQELDLLREQYAAFIVTTSTFLEQCHSRGILDSNNVQNETLEMGRALDIVRPDNLLENLRKGASGQIFDLMRGMWVTVPIREDHCRMILGEQEKIKKSLARYFQ